MERLVQKCIVFDIWGNYGHFRKPYSTNSSLTYFFPTKPTIIGILAAIVGLQKNSYYDLIDRIKVSLIIRNSEKIRKNIFTINYENTKKTYFEHSPVNVELLLNPRFTILLYISEESYRNDERLKNFYTSLMNNLKEHKSVYTVSLGSAFCIANFKFQDEVEIRPTKGQNIVINSIVPKTTEIRIKIVKDNHLIIENMPYVLNNERKPTRFMDFYADIKGNGPMLKEASYYIVGNENVIFF